MKWISLQDARPKYGQLVVVLEPRWSEQHTAEVVARPTIWGKDSALYPAAQSATHWYPIPDVRPSAKRLAHDRRRMNWPPSIRAEADALEAKMKKRAPLVEWIVEPTSMIRSTHVSDPDGTGVKEITNFYAHGWRITGEFGTGLGAFTFSREVTDEYFREARIDILDYIAHEMARAIANELMKGNHEAPAGHLSADAEGGRP